MSRYSVSHSIHQSNSINGDQLLSKNQKTIFEDQLRAYKPKDTKFPLPHDPMVEKLKSWKTEREQKQHRSPTTKKLIMQRQENHNQHKKTFEKSLRTYNKSNGRQSHEKSRQLNSNQSVYDRLSTIKNTSSSLYNSANRKKSPTLSASKNSNKSEYFSEINSTCTEFNGNNNDYIDQIEDRIEDLYQDFMEGKHSNKQQMRNHIIEVLKICQIKIVKGLMIGGIEQIKLNQQLWYIFMLNFDFKLQWKENALNFLKNNEIMQLDYLQFVEEKIEVIPDNKGKPQKITNKSDNKLTLDQLNKENNMSKMQNIIDQIKYEDIQQGLQLQESKAQVEECMMVEDEELINEQISTETIQQPLTIEMNIKDQINNDQDQNEFSNQNKEMSMKDDIETEDNYANNEVIYNENKTEINDNKITNTLETNYENESNTESMKNDDQQIESDNQFKNPYDKCQIQNNDNENNQQIYENNEKTNSSKLQNFQQHLTMNELSLNQYVYQEQQSDKELINSSIKQQMLQDIQIENQNNDNKIIEQQITSYILQNEQIHENNLLKKRIKNENGQYKNIYQYNINNNNNLINNSLQIIQDTQSYNNQHQQQLSQISSQQQTSSQLYNAEGNIIKNCSSSQENIYQIKSQSNDQDFQPEQNAVCSKIKHQNEQNQQNSDIYEKKPQIKDQNKDNQYELNMKISIQKPSRRKDVRIQNNGEDTNKQKRKSILGIDIRDIYDQDSEDFGCEYVQFVICSTSQQKKSVEEINVQFVRRSMRNSKRNQKCEEEQNAQQDKKKGKKSNKNKSKKQKNINQIQGQRRSKRLQNKSK